MWPWRYWNWKHFQVDCVWYATIERKMRNYRAGTLRLRASQLQAQAVDDPNVPTGRDDHRRPFSFLAALKSKLFNICPCACRNSSTSRFNNARSQKRAVLLYMAMSYSLTFALTWIPTYILIFVCSNKATRVLNGIIPQFQGLYNFLVYISSKVSNVRNTKRGKLPWH